ncbi:MAG: hypothetical protein WDN45_18705 [Caulobacteraceae bacterium]
MQQHVGRVVVDLRGPDRVDEGQVVGDRARMRHQVGNPAPALPILSERRDRPHHRERRLGVGHGRHLGVALHRRRDLLAVAPDHLGLVVEGVDLADRALHVDVDHALGLGGELAGGQLAEVRAGVAAGHRARARRPRHAAAQQFGRRDGAQAHAGAEDGPAREVGQFLRIDRDLLVHVHPS